MSEAGEYLPRHIDHALAEALGSFPVVILDGARGTGKTTSARQLCTSEVLLPRDLEPLRVDPEGYLRSLERPVLLDEWQLGGTELLWTIKRIVDDDPAPGQFVLTGSVEPASYGPTYPLTARAVRIMLRPMTMAELRGRGADPTLLQQLVQHGAKLTSSAGRATDFELAWLSQPGFPAALALPDAQLYLDSYATLVSQRAGDEGRDATRLMRSMRALATLTGQAVPDQRIWEAADINKSTWKAYDDLLFRVHLATPAPAFESNRLKRLTSYPKRYLADTALALTLAGVSADDLGRNSSMAGRYLESFVVQQLRPQVDQIRSSLFHLRTGAGEREVDIVIETPQAVIGMEVKLGTRPTVHDARQLGWVRDELGVRFSHGFVVHTGGDIFPLGERIWAIPVTSLISGEAA